MLKQTILKTFEEVKSERHQEIQLESLSTSYQTLVKFLLQMVRKGKFQRNYDIDTTSGRMVFVTMGGKKVVFNDMKLGVTAFKTWKGKKSKEFFDYTAHADILKWSQAG
jgi:hypothetical protein